MAMRKWCVRLIGAESVAMGGFYAHWEAEEPWRPALPGRLRYHSTMQKKYRAGLMWFRRDLRAGDNAALYHALKACKQVFCVFVFDRDILDSLPRSDRRVEFIRESLLSLDGQLRQLGAAQGNPGACR
jgi:deoxyribodipyrimidine photo-lyase